VNDFDWNTYIDGLQDNGSVFDAADDFSTPVVHMGDFIPELELELDYATL